MKITLVLAVLFCALVLTGCSGDIMSPSDSHDTTTTTDITNTAELSQDDARPVCVGLIVTGCDVSQELTQSASTKPVQAAPEAERLRSITWADVGRWFLIAFMCSFLFYVLLIGIRFIFATEADAPV